MFNFHFSYWVTRGHLYQDSHHLKCSFPLDTEITQIWSTVNLFFGSCCSYIAFKNELNLEFLLNIPLINGQSTRYMNNYLKLCCLVVSSSRPAIFKPSKKQNKNRILLWLLFDFSQNRFYVKGITFTLTITGRASF